MRIRVPMMALCTAGMAVGLAASAMADMYYYRDGNGQLHLTNVLASIPARDRSRVVKTAKPQGRSVTSAPKPQAPEAPKQAMPTQATSVVPEPASQRVGPDGSGAVAAAVSTRDFGLLRLRMTDVEVLQRLGRPVAITEVGRPASGHASRGRTIRVVRGESWYYPGSGSVPPTRLEFSNGLLVHKQRLQR